MKSSISGALALAFLAMGCGNDGASGGVVACNHESVHSCAVYDSDAARSDLENACTSTNGTVVDECPAADLVGKCTVSSGSQEVTTYYYSTSGATSQSVMQACSAANGTYSAN